VAQRVEPFPKFADELFATFFPPAILSLVSSLADTLPILAPYASLKGCRSVLEYGLCCFVGDHKRRPSTVLVSSPPSP